MDSEDVIFLLVIPMAVIIGGVVVIVAALRYRARLFELVHQERVAMIERGMVPPDVNPLTSGPRYATGEGQRSRSFSLGIITVGFGFALMMLIGFAGQSPGEGIGVGGAIVILGAAFIARSLLASPTDTAASRPPARSLPDPGPPAPPQADAPPLDGR